MRVSSDDRVVPPSTRRLKPLPGTLSAHEGQARVQRREVFARPSSRNEVSSGRHSNRIEARLDEGNLKAWNKSFEEDITDPDVSADESEYQSESGMSLSDLNSLGFESIAALGSNVSGYSGPSSLLSETVLRSNSDNPSAIIGLLRAPYVRALSLIARFMESNNSPMTAKACATRKLCTQAYQQLYAQCREMFILALKRDMLSRLAALYLVTEKIPRLVEAGDYATMLSELKLHARHVADLQALHAQFLEFLPSLTLPSLASAEARFQHEIRRAAGVAAAALAARIEALAGVTPLPEQQVPRRTQKCTALRAVLRAKMLCVLRNILLPRCCPLPFSHPFPCGFVEKTAPEARRRWPTPTKPPPPSSSSPSPSLPSMSTPPSPPSPAPPLPAPPRTAPSPPTPS